MANVTLGYLLWDSIHFINCDCPESGDNPSNVVTCGDGWNPRGAQLIPNVDCATGEVSWILYDYVNTYADIDGARNGIAVTNPETGVIYVWDVNGTDDENGVADKLDRFLQLCNCVDCDGGLELLAGEYECDYPSIPSTSYKYEVTVTDGENPLGIRHLAMNYNANLIGYPYVKSFNEGTGVHVYVITLNAPIATIGHPSNQSWVLV